MAEIKLKIDTPSVPNFVRIDCPPGTRQSGFVEKPMMSLGELTDEQLESLASDWKVALFENAKRQRENAKRP